MKKKEYITPESLVWDITTMYGVMVGQPGFTNSGANDQRDDEDEDPDPDEGDGF